MDDSNNSSQFMKKYTRELRTLLENDGLISLKEFKSLQEKYVINKDDINKIDEIAFKLCEKAEADYNFGNWDSALTNIDEAFHKSPFNENILDIYSVILIKYSKLSNKPEVQLAQLDKILKRLQQVDKRTYTKHNKAIKINNKSKGYKKIWLLLFIIPIIALLFLLFNNFNENSKSTPVYIPETYLGPVNGKVPVNINNLTDPAELKIEIKESLLTSNNDKTHYSLSFLLSSAKENITTVKGTITWLNRENTPIYTDTFTAGNGKEFYLNETIPYQYTKSLTRNDPDLYNIEIGITEINSMPGRERPQLDEIAYFLPHNTFRKLNFKKASYVITEGVVSNYLTITLIIENRDSKGIEELLGQIQWLDSYNIVIAAANIDFINDDDLTLNPGESRTIHKTIEIPENITSIFNINIRTIK